MIVEKYSASPECELQPVAWTKKADQPRRGMMFRTTEYGTRMGFDVHGLFIVEAMLVRPSSMAARDKINARYAHGGGWHSFEGFERASPDSHTLTFRGDPPLHPLATMEHAEEVLAFYEGEWLAVFQPDGTFEISRID